MVPFPRWDFKFLKKIQMLNIYIAISLLPSFIFVRDNKFNLHYHRSRGLSKHAKHPPVSTTDRYCNNIRQVSFPPPVVLGFRAISAIERYTCTSPFNNDSVVPQGLGGGSRLFSITHHLFSPSINVIIYKLFFI